MEILDLILKFKIPVRWYKKPGGWVVEVYFKGQRIIGPPEKVALRIKNL